jgi:hypothetical protein
LQYLQAGIFSIPYWLAKMACCQILGRCDAICEKLLCGQ